MQWRQNRKNSSRRSKKMRNHPPIRKAQKLSRYRKNGDSRKF